MEEKGRGGERGGGREEGVEEKGEEGEGREGRVGWGERVDDQTRTNKSGRTHMVSLSR